MDAVDLFADMKQSADTAFRKASEDTADELTKKFRAHLIRGGVPREDAKQANVVYNPETRDFDPDVPDSVQNHSQGDEDKAPSGVVTKFFNRLSSAQIDKMHNQHLLTRSKEGGLA